MLKMRFLSPFTTSFAWLRTVKVRCLDWTCAANSVSKVSAIRFNLNGLDRIATFLLSNLKYSKRLFNMDAIRPAEVFIVSAWRTRLSLLSSFSKSSALPLMAVKGVRSSWLTFCMRLRRKRISSSFLALLSCNSPISFHAFSFRPRCVSVPYGW